MIIIIIMIYLLSKPQLLNPQMKKMDPFGLVFWFFCGNFPGILQSSSIQLPRLGRVTGRRQHYSPHTDFHILMPGTCDYFTFHNKGGD